MSHTTKINVEFKDKDSLGKAIKAMGGQVLGEGSHRLYSGSVTGWGFTLPGWNYPLILGSDNALSYDNYNGAWGDAKALDTLKSEYSLCVAETYAYNQGWITERQGAEVIIHHPDGGIIKVSAAGLDAAQFLGADCVEACQGLEMALGSQPERMLKQEYFQRPQEIIIKE